MRSLITNLMYELTDEVIEIPNKIPTPNDKLTPLFVNEEFIDNFNWIRNEISTIDLPDLV